MKHYRFMRTEVAVQECYEWVEAGSEEDAWDKIELGESFRDEYNLLDLLEAGNWELLDATEVISHLQTSFLAGEVSQ